MPRLFCIRMVIQIEQFMDGCRIVALDDVNLLVGATDVVSGAEMFCRRMFAICDDAFDSLLRSMSLEFASEHLDVRPVTMKRVTRAVRSHKCMPLPNPIN